MSILDKFNQSVDAPDAAKFILRVSFAAMFLLHGVHKLYAGVDFIGSLFVEHGLPFAFAYLTYLAEVVVPILLIVGVFTRLSAFVGVAGCVIIAYFMHANDFFTTTQVGAWAVEGVAVYFFAFLAIMLLGSGKYALKAD